MILVLDCHDSFVQTLARYLREAGEETMVVRCDALSVEEALSLRPSGILLSPGPYRPGRAGIALPLIGAAGGIPLLGVCLGHQAICEAYGGRTVLSPEPMHGRATPVRHRGDPVFAGVPNPFSAARYHALLGEPGPALEVIAESDGLPMAVRHRERPHIGLQFHPESLLTEGGHAIMTNFAAMTRRAAA
ncbi:anthranilate synthase component II [Parvularcula oceani]|uniref:anthranilate synthase component II n=1 Tax=Parvularcula oceani TaxID=1247963 RepID=UPI0004E0BCDC|nr:aminodeoxychorismate/anthranilate synthase component II [Parvularcula oceani]